eukprot:UN06193
MNIVNVLCEMKVGSPSFLSKSLSSLQRPSLKSISLVTKKSRCDIKSASSNSLANLKLINVPTLSETATPMSNNHHLKATLTPLNLFNFDSQTMQLPETKITNLPVVYD